MYIDITNLNALYTQRSNMLLNNDIQVQRPNTLHNKIQPTYFPFYSSHTIWSKPSACPVTLTPCCLRSIVKTFALSHASTRARPDSFMLERFHSFDSTKKNKAHSQSNKPTSTVGSLKPPSSFDRTIDLYSAALSAEGYWIERFILSCLWQGCPVPTDSKRASRSSGQSKCMAFTPWLEVEVVVFEVLIQDNRADCIASFLPKGDHIEYPCRPPQDQVGVLVADGKA